MSERKSEWPGTSICILGYSGPQCDGESGDRRNRDYDLGNTDGGVSCGGDGDVRDGDKSGVDWMRLMVMVILVIQVIEVVMIRLG